MKILGIIPARYGSTRFPGKPLVDINGKTMIRRVYEQAKSCNALSQVIVATDDERIFKEVLSFGGEVIMTASEHQSGTDRCAEVINKSNESYSVVINIQGDEPYINPEQIKQLCECFLDPNTQIATLAKKINNSDELFDENKVKVVLSNNRFALYFSRIAVPFFRGEEKENWIKKHDYFKHIGIYGYRTDVLQKITQLQPSTLELAESLEQLRWLEYGYSIKVAKTVLEAISIDTPDDLRKITG